MQQVRLCSGGRACCAKGAAPSNALCMCSCASGTRPNRNACRASTASRSARGNELQGTKKQGLESSTWRRSRGA